MSMMKKFKGWAAENAPTLNRLFDNKYVGMVYDRFAGLPSNQQRQLTIAGMALLVLIVVLYLFSSLLGLWGLNGKSDDAQKMLAMIQKYQKQSQEKGVELKAMGRNNFLIGNGAIKNHLVGQARTASISPRMIKVEETMETKPAEDGEGQSVRVKRATVTLERVNLNQTIEFLKSVEFGSYDLNISSLTITNDKQLRGYMNVEMGIVAYLFDVGVDT